MDFGSIFSSISDAAGQTSDNIEQMAMQFQAQKQQNKENEFTERQLKIAEDQRKTARLAEMYNLKKGQQNDEWIRSFRNALAQGTPVQAQG